MGIQASGTGVVRSISRSPFANSFAHYWCGCGEGKGGMEGPWKCWREAPCPGISFQRSPYVRQRTLSYSLNQFQERLLDQMHRSFKVAETWMPTIFRESWQVIIIKGGFEGEVIAIWERSGPSSEPSSLSLKHHYMDPLLIFETLSPTHSKMTTLKIIP